MKNKLALMLGIGGVAAAICVAVALTDAGNAPSKTSSSRKPTPGGHAASQTLGRERVQKRVKGDLKTLVVQRDELPGEFSIAGGEPKGAREFAQIYFNPQAFEATDADNAGVLGVIINLTLLDDLKAAHAKFVAQGGLEPNSVRQDVRSSTPGAVPRHVAPYSMSVPGTDRVLAFHVQYVLQETEVHEYRIRMIVGNALVNLIISARATADGGQPADFEQHARTIVNRQAARLTAARR